jgi:hypothetical protein
VITRRWQRVTLLGVLGYEAAGAVLGGSLLAAVPDGRLIDMPVDIMEGTFHDFFIPGLILLGLGILNAAAFVAVFRRHRADWILAGLASGGLAVWLGVEIAVLQQLHWLHAMWGLPVVLGGMVALPLVPARHATLRNALLACGIVASLLYVTATILGAMRYPGYHFTSHTVSELFAIDAPSKALVDPLLVAYSLLWIAFGVGVWLSAGRSLALRIAAAGLIGKEIEGVVVQLFFPMHQRGVAATSNDPMHGVLTYVGVRLLSGGHGVRGDGLRHVVPPLLDRDTPGVPRVRHPNRLGGSPDGGQPADAVDGGVGADHHLRIPALGRDTGHPATRTRRHRSTTTG